MIYLISPEIVWLLFSLWQNMVCHFVEPNLLLHEMADLLRWSYLQWQLVEHPSYHVCIHKFVLFYMNV